MRGLTRTNVRRTPGVLFVRAPLLLLLGWLWGLGEWAKRTSFCVHDAVPGWERGHHGAP